MTRQTLDEYLDGMLDAAGSAAVERAIRDDAGTARLAARMKAERALRTAALAGHAPPADEARRLTERVMAACVESELAPVGRIGPWIWARRVAAVAAAIVLVAGAFALGRATAAPAGMAQGGKETPDKIYNVVFMEPGAVPQVRDFSTEEDMQNAVREYEARRPGVVLAANLDQPGIF